MKYISVSDLESIEKDMTLLNGAKHRCIDSTQIYELPKIELVRCKDCKNSECVGRFGDIVCGRTGTPHRPEWFCPCGEPKDGEQDG